MIPAIKVGSATEANCRGNISVHSAHQSSGEGMCQSQIGHTGPEAGVRWGVWQACLCSLQLWWGGLNIFYLIPPFPSNMAS